MDVAIAFATSVVSSAVVATAVGAIMKFRFDRRLLELNQQSQIQIARLAEATKLQFATAHELASMRLRSLSELEAVLYRVRNDARALSGVQQPGNIADHLARLKNDVSALEETLYEKRLFLELEGIFRPIHAYKNTALTLAVHADDVESYARVGERENEERSMATVLRLYQELEDQHSLILSGLKAHSNPMPEHKQLRHPET